MLQRRMGGGITIESRHFNMASTSSSEQMFQVVTNPMNFSMHGVGSMDVESPTPTTPTIWTTNILDCLKDEESCWWGTWCCCLLQARTADAFDLKLSKHSIVTYVACTLAWIFMGIVISPGVGLLTLLVTSMYLAFTRGEIRHGIRQRLAYQNRSYFCWIPLDYILHFCICSSPCAICQEAREGKAYGLRKLDFCSGQPLSELIEAHERAVGRQSNDASDILIPSNGNFSSHFNALSRLSRMLLVLSLVAMAFASLYLFSKGLFDQVGILLLIFVQPITILYFFYWRTRRSFASLDMTVKMFMTGFWVSTFQALIIEGSLEILLSTVLSKGFGINLQDLQSNGGSNNNGNSEDGSVKYAIDSNINGSVDNDMVKLAMNLMYKLQEITFQGGDSGENQGGHSESMDDMGVDDESLLTALKKHIVLIILLCFLVSFCIAAAVEETCKHFAVRNCLRISPLKEPNVILVFLMSAALGFATAENIEYVLGSGSVSPIPGYSATEGQLIVLLARWCSPLHVICSVLQAVGLSYAVMDIGTKNLFMILLPAICLHGTFDFTMFMADAISVIYKIDNTSFLIGTITCAAIIVISSTTYACMAYKKVEDLHQNRWSSLSGDDRHDDADFVEIQF